MCNRRSPLRVDGEAGPGLGGALSRLLGAGQEINCEEEIGNIEREATLLHLACAHGINIKLIKAKDIIFIRLHIHVRDGLILYYGSRLAMLLPSSAEFTPSSSAREAAWWQVC